MFNLTYIIIVLTQLLMVIGLNLSFRLSTQVVYGRVYIVAIDKHGRQLFQVQMKHTSRRATLARTQGGLSHGRRGRISQIVMTEQKESSGYLINEWMQVDNDSYKDDITSMSYYPSSNSESQSPLSAMSAVFVDDFREAVKGDKQCKENYSIN